MNIRRLSCGQKGCALSASGDSCAGHPPALRGAETAMGHEGSLVLAHMNPKPRRGVSRMFCRTVRDMTLEASLVLGNGCFAEHSAHHVSIIAASFCT